ncbi:MAG: glutaminase family protein [Candidatus Aminicenantales bacterium]
MSFRFRFSGAILILVFVAGVFAPFALTSEIGPFRPPAVPLVIHDPYFSIWATADRLSDDWPRHWTGKIQAMSALVRIDGEAFRLMGTGPENVPAAAQIGLTVTPTKTTYVFKQSGVDLALEFLAPQIITDLDLLGRPVTYISITARSADGRPHAVSAYFDASSEIAVDETSQKVVWSRLRLDGLEALAIGTQDQRVLDKTGDDRRIDWGYMYLAVPNQSGAITRLSSADESRGMFVREGWLPVRDDFRMPRPVRDVYPVAAAAFDLGNVAAAEKSRWLMLAYDDQFAIEYFFRKLRPYWRRAGVEVPGLLESAAKEYDGLRERCAEFDTDLLADMVKAGGEKYARLAVLSYRQSLAAHKLAADIDGTPLFFPKENFSNGCISTVDVIYPEAPMYLLMNPALMRGLIIPVLEYARGTEWKFPFAPHDLGTYPKANGQVYGGGAATEEDQMPVEESGNMLLIVAGLVQAEGRADFALEYWPLLERWANYLKEKGFDPENQLCTDDFAGHLAHNANLSVKAILGLRAYADLCDRVGKKKEADLFKKTAAEYAKAWIKQADDGDHYRLAFDKPGTWSQKYNLVWDKLLGYNLFPSDVARKEIAWYKTVQKTYGLPLDNRREYTKLDWILWTATIADSAEDFAAFLDPVYRWMNETPDRVPLTDWYWTNSGKKTGFQARPVVGGVLIKMLADPALRLKWAAAGKKS